MSPSKPINPKGKASTSSLFLTLCQKGFSLIEILVAMTLGALLLYVAVSNPGASDRDGLDKAMDTVEKVVQFSINESILRNRITRTSFDLSGETSKISVEYSHDKEFVLPEVSAYDGISLGEREKKAKEKLVKKVNSGFKPVGDIDKEKLQIPESVEILGVATSLRPALITDEKTSLYVYPSGERDKALIIFAVFNEIAALMVEPYTGEFKRKYRTVHPKKELDQEYEQITEELLDEWLD